MLAASVERRGWRSLKRCLMSQISWAVWLAKSLNVYASFVLSPSAEERTKSFSLHLQSLRSVRAGDHSTVVGMARAVLNCKDDAAWLIFLNRRMANQNKEGPVSGERRSSYSYIVHIRRICLYTYCRHTSCFVPPVSSFQPSGVVLLSSRAQFMRSLFAAAAC